MLADFLSDILCCTPKQVLKILQHHSDFSGREKFVSKTEAMDPRQVHERRAKRLLLHNKLFPSLERKKSEGGVRTFFSDGRAEAEGVTRAIHSVTRIMNHSQNEMLYTAARAPDLTANAGLARTLLWQLGHTPEMGEPAIHSTPGRHGRLSGTVQCTPQTSAARYSTANPGANQGQTGVDYFLQQARKSSLALERLLQFRRTRTSELRESTPGCPLSPSSVAQNFAYPTEHVSDEDSNTAARGMEQDVVATELSRLIAESRRNVAMRLLQASICLTMERQELKLKLVEFWMSDLGTNGRTETNT
jgi:hypothetical protein